MRTRKIIPGLAVAILSAGVAFAAVLVAAHFVLSSRPLTPAEEAYADEAATYGNIIEPARTPRLKDLRWVAMKPNATARTGSIEVRTNGLGFRDLEHDRRKGSDEFRLVVIGDSYVYGQGIRDVGDIFARRLGIDRIDGKRLNVILMGYCGADLLLYNAMFHDLALPLEPDAVLLSLTSNDLEDRSRPNVNCLPRLLGRLLSWSGPLQAEAEKRCNVLFRHYEKELARQYDRTSEGFRREEAALEEMRATAAARGIDLFAFYFTTRPMGLEVFSDLLAEQGIPFAALYPEVQRIIGEGLKEQKDFYVSEADQHPGVYAHGLASAVVSRLLLEQYGGRAEGSPP